MSESPLFHTCAIDVALELIGSKWALNILRDLSTGKKRTSELMKSLPGISPRTLSERLRELEDNGLISRTVFAEIPPRVEYALTPKGQLIKPVMIALTDFGSKFQQRAKGNGKRECTHCRQKVESGCKTAVILSEESEFEKKK